MRECLALYVARSISSKRVIHLLGWLFAARATPQFLRSDNGPEFVAHAVQDWLAEQHCQILCPFAFDSRSHWYIVGGRSTQSLNIHR